MLLFQILARDDLCVESEGVLLDLVLRWAEDKVRGNISVSCQGLHQCMLMYNICTAGREGFCGID